MVKILSFGYEREFLQKRHDALAHAGFKVHSVTTSPEVKRLIRAKQFDIFIVGHAVPLRERVETVEMAKSLLRIPIICFYEGSINQVELADAVLSTEGSIEDLVFTIHRLIADTEKRSPGVPQRA